MAVERAVDAVRAGREGGHVLEMQRRRLLSATVELAYERGVQSLTVATICERAGLSRKTFYDLFDGREECLLATFTDAVEQAVLIVEQAVADAQRTQTARNTRKVLGWCDRIRVGLAALLSFFDREPGIGRLLVVEALSAGAQTLQARRRVLGRVIELVDQGRGEVRGYHEPPPLTAEGVVGAVFAVIHARVLDGAPVIMGRVRAGERDRESLVEQTGSLMAMIVQPYLGGAAARRELARPVVPCGDRGTPNLPSDPFKDLPIRFTYRTSRVLSSIAEIPGASNKQIAQASGITDDGQTSRLLTRLQRHDLIQDTGIGPTKGMPRAWTLTTRGEQILQVVGHN